MAFVARCCHSLPLATLISRRTRVILARPLPASLVLLLRKQEITSRSTSVYFNHETVAIGLCQQLLLCFDMLSHLGKSFKVRDMVNMSMIRTDFWSAWSKVIARAKELLVIVSTPASVEANGARALSSLFSRTLPLARRTNHDECIETRTAYPHCSRVALFARSTRRPLRTHVRMPP
jgi:hypothetical protein